MRPKMRGPGVAILSLLLAAPFAAQQAGAPPQRPGGPPPAQNQVRARTQQAQPGTVQWRAHRRIHAQEMVQAENQYRHQIARLERMRELYGRQSRPERVAELERLRVRIREHYQSHQAECRDALGDQDRDRLMDRIQDRLHEQDRDRLPDRDRDMDQDRDRDRDMDRDPDRDRDRDRDRIQDDKPQR